MNMARNTQRVLLSASDAVAGAFLNRNVEAVVSNDMANRRNAPSKHDRCVALALANNVNASFTSVTSTCMRTRRASQGSNGRWQGRCAWRPN